MSKTHELKCLRPYFEAVVNHTKPFEFRRNDRGFAVGDTIVLREVERDPTTDVTLYTGRRCERVVTYLLDSELYDLEIPEGFCILGLGLAARQVVVTGDDVAVHFDGDAKLGFSPHILVELLRDALIEKPLIPSIPVKLTEVVVKDGFAMLTVRRDYPLNDPQDAGGDHP